MVRVRAISTCIHKVYNRNMHYLHTHWPCVLQQPHQKHITIRQLKHTTTNKLHYNINHCYLWFAVSKRKHSAEQNHPRGGDFPSKKKKKVSRLGPFFAIFQLQLRNLYGFFFDNRILLVNKKNKKNVIITFWLHVFLYP